MHLINSCSVLSPEHSAYLDLMIEILNHVMAEKVYSAEIASLDYSVTTSSKGGLIIKVYNILCMEFSFCIGLLIVFLLVKNFFRQKYFEFFFPGYFHNFRSESKYRTAQLIDLTLYQ